MIIYLVPGQAERQLLNELNEVQDMMHKLQRSSRTDTQSRLSQIEIALMNYAHEIIVRGTRMYEASPTLEFNTHSQDLPTSNGYVAEWVTSLDSVRQDQQRWKQSNMEYEKAYSLSAQDAQSAVTRSDDDEDDLDTDLVRAALDTGTKAFEVQQWQDTEYLLNEALRVLRQLPVQKQMFCDVFNLHYKLAICAYHTQTPVGIEEALKSIVRQPVSSDTQRACIYNATHLLSQLYIRTGQIDRARSECEKALQARRRLLGKQSDASLESLALMAHIYVLLSNRALAKSCLAMIPEGRRDAVLATVELSLGPTVQHLDFQSLLTPPMPRDSPRSEFEVPRFVGEVSGSSMGLGMESGAYGPTSTTASSPTGSPLRAMQCLTSFESSEHDMPSTVATSHSSVYNMGESTSLEKNRSAQDYRQESVRNSSTAMSQPIQVNSIVATNETSQVDTPKFKPLSRKEILDKIGCHPRDRVEEAVYASDGPALATLLNKKKSFWRSSLRKRVRSERVTALHFAALFGEIDMAQRLLDSKFNINEIPFGYTSSLTPLHFAIGARQVEMVDFLIANGAKPSEPDSWSTLAGQLMSRSWLMKTMSEAEKDIVPSRIVAIMNILLTCGWAVNESIDKSGKTVLHQAVSFWTGLYRWDLDLRACVTLFLCERGADPLRANGEGKTPYDLALASDHHDLISILDRHSRFKELGGMSVEPVELPSHPS
jgi:ankyrin repeat protein/tetratricopeptide (TPR) repeat protein